MQQISRSVRSAAEKRYEQPFKGQPPRKRSPADHNDSLWVVPRIVQTIFVVSRAVVDCHVQSTQDAANLSAHFWPVWRWAVTCVEFGSTIHFLVKYVVEAFDLSVQNSLEQWVKKRL